MIVGDTVTIGTLEFIVRMTSTDLVVVEVETSETAVLVTFIRSIWASSFTITVTFLRDTVTGTALPLRFLAAAFLVVVEIELLEAAFLVTFVRSISALGFSITHIRFLDAITVGASPLSFWIAATDLGVVLFEASEAAEILTFIRLIGTLGLTVTVVCQLDAISAVTLPFIILAAALLVIIECKVSETAVVITFVRTIFTLGLTVAKSALEDAVTVSTLPLIFQAATFLVVVERELLETAVLFTFIGSIQAVGLSITLPRVLDALAVAAGPFSIRVAATDFGAVGLVFLEAAVLVTLIRSVFALGLTIT
jgi:hypothetical protein